MAIRSLKTGQFSRSVLVGNPVIMPGSYESIATVTVGSGGAANVTFSSIPSTYTHLQIRCIGRSSAATGFSWSYITFNSDTGGNYASHYIRGDGASATASALTGTGNNTEVRTGEFPRANATSGIFGGLVIDILDYKNTDKYKTVRSLGGVDLNGSGRAVLYSGLWQNTNAVTSIKLTPQTDNWEQYSHFALYGVN